MCEISRKNSEWLLRKWQKNLGDTFFAAHCRPNTQFISYRVVSNRIENEQYPAVWR